MPPINDDLDNAYVVEALPFSQTLDVSDATLQTNEPFENTYDATVWYALVIPDDAPAGLRVRASTTGSTHWTAMALWGNTIRTGESLTTGWSSLSYIVTAGETYFLQVGRDTDGSMDPGTLELSLTASVSGVTWEGDLEAGGAPSPDLRLTQRVF